MQSDVAVVWKLCFDSVVVRLSGWPAVVTQTLQQHSLGVTVLVPVATICVWDGALDSTVAGVAVRAPAATMLVVIEMKPPMKGH